MIGDRAADAVEQKGGKDDPAKGTPFPSGRIRHPRLRSAYCTSDCCAHLASSLSICRCSHVGEEDDGRLRRTTSPWMAIPEPQPIKAQTDHHARPLTSDAGRNVGGQVHQEDDDHARGEHAGMDVEGLQLLHVSPCRFDAIFLGALIGLRVWGGGWVCHRWASFTRESVGTMERMSRPIEERWATRPCI